MNIEEKRKAVNALSILFNTIDYLRIRSQEAGKPSIDAFMTKENFETEKIIRKGLEEAKEEIKAYDNNKKIKFT